MSWAHKSDPEWMAFTNENAKGGAILLFGRVTYDMMASFWPTADARKFAPQVADAMNRMTKVVFSHSLKQVTWSNARLVKDDLVGTVRKMKETETQPLLIMGSGKIVSQLAKADLIDSYQLVINPIVLGAGRTMFEGVERTLLMTLTDTRRFTNGNVVLWYRRDRQKK